MLQGNLPWDDLRVPTINWHLPSTSSKINSCASAAADLQYLLKGVQSKGQKWGMLAPKNWCFWTVALEKTLESPLDCKEIQPVHPKGDQSWVFIGRTDAEAKTPILWPPLAKSWVIGKDPDAGRDWGQEEKGTTEDEMAGWHHQLNAHEFGWTPGVGDGQGGLTCCNSWGHKELDTTERLNWTDAWGCQGELSRYWGIFTIQFHKPNSCISSHLEKY